MKLAVEPSDFKSIDIENYYRINLTKTKYKILRTYYIFINNLRRNNWFYI